MFQVFIRGHATDGRTHKQRRLKIDRQPVVVITDPDEHIRFTLEYLSFQQLGSKLYGLYCPEPLDLYGLPAV